MNKLQRAIIKVFIKKFLQEKKIIVDQCLIEANCVHVSITFYKNRNMFGYYLNNKFVAL